jgi:hypothetical protein
MNEEEGRKDLQRREERRKLFSPWIPRKHHCLLRERNNPPSLRE